MSCYSAIVLCVRSIAFLLSCTKRRPVGGGGEEGGKMNIWRCTLKYFVMQGIYFSIVDSWKVEGDRWW